MKKIIYFAAAAIALLACQKQSAVQMPLSSEQAMLNVSLSDLSTKAVTTLSGEMTVSDLQVFVFRPDGALDAYGHGSGSSISVSCTYGNKDVVALVNAPAVADVTSYEGLCSKVSDLKDNGRSSLVMSGETTAEVSGSTSVEIEVSRLAARISIGSIVNNFTLDQYRNEEFTVKGIYLVNVAGGLQYLGGTPSVATWYNFSRNNSSEVSSLVYSGTMNDQVEAGGSFAAGKYFYCYPNDGATKPTRLVVEATLGSETYYYPVTIRSIEANHAYEITRLTVTRPGADNPDEEISLEDATFEIVVKDWIPGTSMDVEI